MYYIQYNLQHVPAGAGNDLYNSQICSKPGGQVTEYYLKFLLRNCWLSTVHLTAGAWLPHCQFCHCVYELHCINFVPETSVICCVTYMMHKVTWISFLEYAVPLNRDFHCWNLKYWEHNFLCCSSFQPKHFWELKVFSNTYSNMH